MDSGSSSEDWYWSKQGSEQQRGPVSLERLRDLAEQGSLEYEDLVRREGSDDWKDAGSVEEVEDLFDPGLLYSFREDLPDDVQEGFPKSIDSASLPSIRQSLREPLNAQVQHGAWLVRVVRDLAQWISGKGS